MNDDADDAQTHIDQELTYLIDNRDTQPAAKATGFCLYCEEPQPAGRRWCDAQCCKAWEQENAKTRRSL